MDKVSKYVSMNEAIRSQVALKLNISNIPNQEQFDNMQAVAMNVFDKVRAHFNVPIFVSSFFRSKKLNEAIPGSSTTSQHLTGEAMDIDADYYGKITNAQIFFFILNNCTFDQLIWEFGDDKNPDWVHVSYSRVKNRKAVLISKRGAKGGVKYEKFVA